jgi:3-hydroxyisobutyrate dehydrogenase-like beta-hydroxyacid dehydrogenase
MFLGIRKKFGRNRMNVKTVAVVAQGEMGSGTSRQLAHYGQRVITNLTGRSKRSIDLAKQAGMEDVGSDAALINEADMFLSILPPVEAVALAKQLAPHIEASNTSILYMDCNAVAPTTKEEIQAIVEPAGARFVDVGILGDPPDPVKNVTRYYASGPHANDFAELKDFGLNIIVCGDTIGRAAAVKMCFANMTKTMVALAAETFAAAEALGVYDEVEHELSTSQKNGFEWASKRVTLAPPKAYRWVGEVEEIGKMFEALGMPGETCVGGAKMFQIIADSPLGEEVVETRKRGTTLEDCSVVTAEYLAKK